MNLCANRGPGGSGRTDTSFLVAGEYLWHGGDESVEGEGKISISVQKGKT